MGNNRGWMINLYMITMGKRVISPKIHTTWVVWGYQEKMVDSFVER